MTSFMSGRNLNRAIAIVGGLLALTVTGISNAQPQCVVSILNRTAVVNPDGSWRVNNIPANLGLVRARFTCVENGVTRRGQSKFFRIAPNIVNGFESTFSLSDPEPVPTRLSIAAAPTTVLTSIGSDTQLAVTAHFSDDSTKDITTAAAGTAYINSTPAVASVSADGLVTALKSGKTLISAQREGRVASLLITVSLGGDTDGDGIPDDVELANGLDPNNATDGKMDVDGDGLTSAQEINLGTKPTVADTDGDGVNDGAEVAANTNPTDATSVDYTGTGLIASISVKPPSITLRTNAIIPQEICRQLRVTAILTTGQKVNITTATTGTTYDTSDPAVANFSAVDGEVCAGSPGTATVTVRNAGTTADVPVTVTLFNPTALGFVGISGQPNAVDAFGDRAYVASGSVGLSIVNIEDPRSPQVISSLNTPGNGNDVACNGNHVLLAAGSAGLQVIDVTDETSPAVVGSVDTPGSANGVFACGQLAFVADGPSGLQIVDISDPTAPGIIGAVDTPGSGFGVAVDAVRGLAAVADGPTGVQLIDVSVPVAPMIVGSIDTNSAYDVVFERDTVLVADGNATSTHGGLVAIDTSDPANPVKTGDTPPPAFLTDVATFGGVATAADIISVNSVHTFIVTDPATPVAALLIDFSRAPSFRDDNGTGIDVQNGFVYMTGTRGFSHLGCCNDGRLHIGQFLELTDDFGVPPRVQIVSPQAGDSFIEGTSVLVQAAAEDDVAVARVDFFLDGAFVSSDAAAPYEAMVNLPLGAQSARLGVQASDLADNRSARVEIDVDVLPNPPPSVVITSPADGDDVVERSTITVTADATDNTTVARVDFLVDGVLISSDMSEPYSAEATIPAGVGPLALQARAVDEFGAEGSATVTVNVIPDPLTTVIGVVVDRDDQAVAGATAETFGLVATTDAAGAFSIPGVPTVLGDIQVIASAVVGGQQLRGRSDSFSPAVGGTTDVGTIRLGIGLGMIADRSSFSVTVFDPSTDTVVGSVPVPFGSSAVGDCAITADATLGFVTDFAFNLWVIDVSASPPVLAPGTNPIRISNSGEDVSLTADQRFAVVCDGSAAQPVSVVDIAARLEVTSFFTGTSCNSVEVCSNGSVLATSSGGTVRRMEIDANGNLVDTGETFFASQPNNVFCSPGGEAGVVVTRGSRNIISFLVPGMLPVSTRTVGFGISGLFDGSGSRVYVRSNSQLDMYDFDLQSGQLSNVPVFSVPISSTLTFFGMDQVTLDSSDTKLYVTQPGRVDVRDASTGALLTTIRAPSISSPTGVCVAGR